MQKTNEWIPRGKGVNWEMGTGVHTLLCIKWVTNENLAHGTRSST